MFLAKFKNTTNCPQFTLEKSSEWSSFNFWRFEPGSFLSLILFHLYEFVSLLRDSDSNALEGENVLYPCSLRILRSPTDLIAGYMTLHTIEHTGNQPNCFLKGVTNQNTTWTLAYPDKDMTQYDKK